VHNSLPGDKNPNWRGGISKNNYHYKKIQMARYPERIRARVAVYYAIKSGKLIKGLCQACGSSVVTAHHDDYTQPLNVQWFCATHHRELHNKNA
jgi:ribosomal protein S27AE